MCWLRVSKLFFNKETKSFGELYPYHAKNLIKFLIESDMISYQRFITDYGHLSIGRYKSLSSMNEIDKLQTQCISFKIRQQYLKDNNIGYELVYSGHENLYSSLITGVELPNANVDSINRFNYKTILGNM